MGEMISDTFKQHKKESSENPFIIFVKILTMQYYPRLVLITIL